MSDELGNKIQADVLARERWRGKIDAEMHSHDAELKQLKETLATKDQVDAIKELVQSSLENNNVKMREILTSINVRCDERGSACSRRYTDTNQKVEANALAANIAAQAIAKKVDTVVMPKVQGAELSSAVQAANFGFWMKITMVLLTTSLAGSGMLVLLLQLTGKL